MDNNNFERASSIINEWPSWKKEYKLTSHSSQHESRSPSDEHDKIKEKDDSQTPCSAKHV